MSARKWYSGPPPSIGWWPASVSKNRSSLRWWNGEWWSVAVRTGSSTEEAARLALIQSDLHRIKWSERPNNWPKESYT